MSNLRTRKKSLCSRIISSNPYLLTLIIIENLEKKKKILLNNKLFY